MAKSCSSATGNSPSSRLPISQYQRLASNKPKMALPLAERGIKTRPGKRAVLTKSCLVQQLALLIFLSTLPDLTRNFCASATSESIFSEDYHQSESSPDVENFPGTLNRHSMESEKPPNHRDIAAQAPHSPHISSSP